MSVWSAGEFESAAKEIARLLQDQDEHIKWFYKSGCLICETTTDGDTPLQSEGSDILTSPENATIEVGDTTDNCHPDNVPYDTDSIILQHVNTKYWAYSITYDHIWQVPVLYFAVQLCDGTPLSRSQVLESLRSLYSDPDGIIDSPDFISLKEHPVSGMPSYFAHPCYVSNRLNIIGDSYNSKVLSLWSWMAMILPFFGLTIRPATFLLIRLNASSIKCTPSNLDDTTTY